MVQQAIANILKIINNASKNNLSTFLCETLVNGTFKQFPTTLDNNNFKVLPAILHQDPIKANKLDIKKDDFWRSIQATDKNKRLLKNHNYNPCTQLILYILSYQNQGWLLRVKQ